MPFDSWGSHLENDIQELEDYWQALDFTLMTGQVSERYQEILQKLLRDLQRQKERKEWELRTHRQRDKERGIKY